MTEVRFRKLAFYGDYSDITPKWHIAADPLPQQKWGVYRALCGFKANNILEDYKISKAKKRPPVAEMCERCLKKENQ